MNAKLGIAIMILAAWPIVGLAAEGKCEFSDPASFVTQSDAVLPFKGIYVDFGAKFAANRFRIFQIEQCSDDKYNCIDSTILSMAFPTEGVRLGQRWSYKGLEYRAEQRSQVRAIGAQQNTLVIRQTLADGSGTVFLVGARGLVGMFFFDREGRPHSQYLLQDATCLPFTMLTADEAAALQQRLN